MALTTEEFVTAFYSLSGTTPGERRKNLFLLLHKTKSSETINFAAVQPRTPLEETFKVEALIFCKRLPELLEVLKTENPILIEKLLKASPWFLEHVVGCVSAKELAQDIFPSLSFNAKVKLLNKLAVHLRDAQKADAIFDAVYEKYGSFLAAKLLPCCSGGVILACVKKTRVELTPRQLLMIVTRHPGLTEPILDALNQFSGKLTLGDKYENVLKHVLQNDVGLFLKLLEKYNPRFCLGWRATNACIVANKQKILANSARLQKLLHNKQVAKSFGPDFPEFYLGLLPTLSKLKDNFNFYLGLLPSKGKKLDLVLRAFQKRYGSPLWEHRSLVTPGLLELMTPEEREVWMDSHEKPAEMSKAIWLCLMKTGRSLPELKKKISVTSDVEERAGLVGCLVETCRINDDKAALTDVCQFVIRQLRNDSSSVLNCFLKTLKDCFGVDQLDDQQWKCVNEIVQLFISRNDLGFYYYDWLGGYISYRLVNELPIKEQMVELATKIPMYSISDLFAKKPQLQKQLFLTYCELIPEIYKEEELENYHLQFLNSVMTFNRKYPTCHIPLEQFKSAFDTLLQAYHKENACHYMAEMIGGSLVRLQLEQPLKDAFLDAYFRRKTFNIDMVSAEWLVKYRPATALKYIEVMTNAILGLWYTLIHSSFWQCCRNYSHLEIPQKITAICLDVLNDKEQTDSNKKNAVTALSHLMQPKDFLTVIAPYHPTDLKMDVNAEDNQETYKIQQAITASLKNVIPPSSVLDSVLSFSKGDYLKFIQRSLHSVAHSTAEENLADFFHALTDRPVSVRKHSIYLTLKVLDKAHIYNMLTEFMESENNASILKILFKGTFSYFGKNPDDYLWEMVKQNLQTVDVNDEEALDALLEIGKVPPAYLTPYTIFTWNFLDALPKPNPKMQERKSRLLDTVSPTLIATLPHEFSSDIIRKYLFKSTSFETQIFSFTCKYLIYNTSQSNQERVQLVFDLLKNYIRSTWYNPDTKRSGRLTTHDFLKEFCSYFIKKDCRTKTILVGFTDLWSSFLKPHEALEDLLLLQFTLIYVDYTTDNLSLPQVAQSLIKSIGALSDLWLHPPGPIDLISACLRSFIGNFCAGTDDDDLEENRLVLVEGMMGADGSSRFLMMAIYLLPRSVPVEPKVKLRYHRIIEKVAMNPDPLVQCALSCYFGDVAGQTEFVDPDENLRGRKSRRPKAFLRYMQHYTSAYAK